MIVSRQKRLVVTAAVLAVLLAAALFTVVTASAAGYVRADRLFTGDGITVQSSYALDSSSDKGVMISASSDGASAQYADTLRGRFEMTFSPFSLPSGTRNYTQLSFVFEENGAELFTVTVENVNDTWSKAYLTRGGSRLGRETGIKVPFTDADQAAADVYFDPSAGDAGAGGQSFGADLSGLGANGYTVRLVFGGVTGRSAVVVYSVNGQSLSGAYIDDSAAPSVMYTPITENAVVGEPYTLPAVSAYDVTDKDSVTLSVTITRPDNGVETAGATYTPTQEGTHYLTITAADTAGNSTTRRLSFEAQRSYDSAIETDAPASVTVGAGGTVVFPAAVGTYGRLVSGTAPVTLTVNGQTFDASEPNVVRFGETGTFTAVYSIDSEGADAGKTVQVEVRDIPVVDVSTESSYARGTVLELPAVQAEKDGQTYETTRTLYMPDGETSDGTVTLDTAGTYRLVYGFVYEGVTYTTERTFEVVTSPETLIADRSGIAAPYYGSSPFYAEEAEGIVIEATSNAASFTYESVIDFTGLTTSGVPLVEFLFMPETQYERDISAVEFTFTDVDDPSNYIRLYIRDDGTAGYEFLCNSYAAAGNNVLIGNFWNVFNTTTGRGCQPRISFRGVGYDGKLQETSRIWFNSSDQSFWGNYQNGSKVNILTLSNSTHVGAGNEWYGFTSGRAKMSVEFTGRGKMLLIGVAGQSLADPLTVSQGTGQLVVLDTGAEGETGTPFPLYDAYVESALDGVTYEYDVRAYGAYGTDSQYELTVADGAFIPDKAGVFTLVYTAVSGGERLEQTVEVTVADTTAAPQITFTAEEEAVFNAGVYLGRTMALPAGTATGTGLSEVTVTADAGTVENGRFIPEEAGQTTLTYTVYDHLGRKAEVKKTVTVTAYDGYLFDEDAAPFAGGVVLDGYTYTLPQLTAYKYAADGTSVACGSKITVSYNGTTTEITGDFTPAVETSGDKMTVTYTPEGGGEPFAYELAVVRTEGVPYRYFYGEGVTFAPQTTSTQITAADGTDVRFANALPAFDFQFNFIVPEENNGLTGVTLTLTDSGDPSVRFSFGLKQADNGTVDYYVNGTRTRGSGAAFAGSSWRLRFDDSTNRVLNSSMALASVAETLDGAAFAGFASGKVYLSVTYEAEGTGTLDVSGVCGQAISGSSGDYGNPSADIADLPRSAAYGSTYTIPATVACDVLDPDITGTVTVRSPSRQIVLEGDAFTEQSFVCNEYGRYTVTFSITDSAGNDGGRSVAVTVRDDGAPTLTVNGTVPSTAEAGKAVNLPQATATDAVDGSLTVVIYLTDTTGYTYRIDGAFTPETSGTYYVTYYAEDSFYNYAKQTFTIRV